MSGTRITAYPDGPLVVRGDFVLDDVDGAVSPTGRMIALCRCGRSARKPLCDGAHANRPRRVTRADATDTKTDPDTDPDRVGGTGSA